MKIKYSKIIPFKGFYAINLFGTLLVSEEYIEKTVSEIALNHESMNTAQMKEVWNV